MKKETKTLLTAVGILSVGFGAYTLWNGYTQEKELQKKILEAEKRAAFVARRRARAQAKAAARTNAALKSKKNETD